MPRQPIRQTLRPCYTDRHIISLEYMTMNETSPKTKLRWYQFSLRSLMICVTLACIVMGVLVVPVHRARQQRAAIEMLRELGYID